MGGAHGREVTVVEGGELWLVVALDDRQDGAVDEADVGVGAEQFPDPVVVGGGGVLDVEGATADVAE